MDPQKRTILFGDLTVPVLERPWSAATDVVGYRQTYRLRPGERWLDASVSEKQFEHLAKRGAEALPVGVLIAGELIDDDGADWAFVAELFGEVVLLDRHAVCVAGDGPVGELLDELKVANGGSLAGLPDVLGRRGRSVILREAKRRGRDRLQPNQHAFVRSASARFGGDLDVAVVEWDLLGNTSSPPTKARQKVFSDECLRLVGEVAYSSPLLSTIADGRSNRIVKVTLEGVLVETVKSAAEDDRPRQVPAWMIDVAWDHLRRHGSLTQQHLVGNDGLNVKRSAFVMALLSRFPGVRIASQSPAELIFRVADV